MDMRAFRLDIARYRLGGVRCAVDYRILPGAHCHQQATWPPPLPPHTYYPPPRTCCLPTTATPTHHTPHRRTAAHHTTTTEFHTLPHTYYCHLPPLHTTCAHARCTTTYHYTARAAPPPHHHTAAPRRRFLHRAYCCRVTRTVSAVDDGGRGGDGRSR